MSGLEKPWEDRVTFVRKNVTENNNIDLMTQLHLPEVTPAVIVIDKNGHESDRFIGLKTADEIGAILKKATLTP